MVDESTVTRGKYMETNEVTTEVRPMGNGAICYVPKSWVGKRVRITVIKKE